jgi:hypothetical protein
MSPGIEVNIGASNSDGICGCPHPKIPLIIIGGVKPIYRAGIFIKETQHASRFSSFALHSSPTGDGKSAGFDGFGIGNFYVIIFAIKA